MKYYRILEKKSFLQMLKKQKLKKVFEPEDTLNINLSIDFHLNKDLAYEDVAYNWNEELGVIEGCILNEFYVKYIHINRVYLNVNNDVILLGESENIVVIKNGPDNRCKFG